MTFEYQEVRTAMAQIEIEDIGNCCVVSKNQLGEEKYLLIKTDIGLTQIVTYGPIIPDIEQLPTFVSYTYQRFDFNEGKIIKIIQKFISDATEVELSEPENVCDNFRDLFTESRKEFY